jgi:hypothetical protein
MAVFSLSRKENATALLSGKKRLRLTAEILCAGQSKSDCLCWRVEIRVAKGNLEASACPLTPPRPQPR